jgi:uncharacterized protein YciI
MKHFLIETTYTAPLEEIEKWTPDHRAFLQTGYDRNFLLISGPQVPRIGGVILGRAASLEEFQAFMADDPFLKQKLATYRFVEFKPVKSHPSLQEWISG